MDKIAFPFDDYGVVSGQDVAVFSYLYALGCNYNIPNGVLHLHISNLAWYTNLSAPIIRKSLDELGQYGVKAVDNVHYTVKLNDLFSKKRRFTLLRFDDVQKIVESDNKRRFDILRYYFLLISTMDRDVHVGDETGFVNLYPSVYFAKVMGIQATSVRKYTAFLEELGIIYVYRVRKSKIPNLIGLIENKNLVTEYAMTHKLYELKGMSFGAAILRYNALCRGKNYSPEEKEEIRKVIIRYNAYHSGKEKDLSVFN